MELVDGFEPRPETYKDPALPTELHQQIGSRRSLNHTGGVPSGRGKAPLKISSPILQSAAFTALRSSSFKSSKTQDNVLRDFRDCFALCFLFISFMFHLNQTSNMLSLRSVQIHLQSEIGSQRRRHPPERAGNLLRNPQS